MDRRVAALYDDDNPDGPDHDCYRALADRVGANTIVDLGCGTGLLTVTLAVPGRRVIGIDPDAGMLAVARARPGTERVEWLLGDSRLLDDPGADPAADLAADLAIMTGNVAMHIGPADWPRTLADLARAVRPGGTLSFESRNPAVEEWRTWTPVQTHGSRDTEFGALTEWLDVTEPDADGTVVLTAHNVWEATGEDVVITQPLTFRTAEQIESDLAAAGFELTEVAGGWIDEPFESTSRLMMVTATRQ